MIPLYIFALLVHAAFSSTPCKDGVEIVSKETNNPGDLIGNWTYVYFWDNVNKFKNEFVNDEADHPLQCPGILIEAVTSDYAKAKEAECASTTEPFKWADTKLRLSLPLMNMNGLLILGENENWLLLGCKSMRRIVLKKISEDYMAIIYPDMIQITVLVAKMAPTLKELKCVTHNVDVGKGMSGVGLCY